MIIAGIDEAGYGPTLGPLVISVSVFRIPEPASTDSAEDLPNLWEVLEPAVCRKPDGRRMPIDDSKKLFTQKKGPRALEEGLLPFLCLGKKRLPRDLRSFLQSVVSRQSGTGSSEKVDAYLDRYPWYKQKNVKLPVDTFENVVRSRATRLASALEAADIEHVALRARPVEVLEFNRGLASFENKARVSFDAIAYFLKRLWARFPDQSVDVIVDRQGGRTHYAPLLFEHIRPQSVCIETQSEELSVYRLRRHSRSGPSSHFRVTFASGSETRHLPVALASMLSKYLREVHMILFNQFWREFREDLKPTAGYALDARRFLTDIQPLRRQLQIDDALLVRRK